MFDVDFNDVDVGARKKPEWLAVAPPFEDRQAMKLHRYEHITL